MAKQQSMMNFQLIKMNVGRILVTVLNIREECCEHEQYSPLYYI